MSEAARERVIAAREAALEAYHSAEESARRNWRRGSRAAGDFFEEQPLVAGAIAVAVGAAIASALPRTRYEDEHLGKYRDDLMDEAERVYREESEKVRHVAEAAVGEARNIAHETADKVRDAAEKVREDVDKSAPGNKSAVEDAADQAKGAAKSAADRVASAADKEAQKQGLKDDATKKS